MVKDKINSLIITLLCLLASMAVKSQTYSKPEIADDKEVCIFLLTPEKATYSFWGYGGNYTAQDGAAFPGDTFIEEGQQTDGMYIYKWAIPDGAKGIPANFTLSKNYKAASGDQPASGKLGDYNFSNHGIYMEVHETTTSDDIALDAGKTVTRVASDDNDPLAVLQSADEHSIFFETPQRNKYYIWAYDDSKSYSGDHFATTTTGFPGDQMTELGQLGNSNYLYKWTQTNNTADMPASMIICRGNGDNKIYDGKAFVNHGYIVETITTNPNGVSVHQFGRAYPSVDNTTSDLDPQAYLNSPNEVSIFLESTKDNAKYYIWPYSDDHDGDYFSEVSAFPGAAFTKIGNLSGGKYLYKWTQNSHITDVPTKMAVSENDGGHKFYEDVFQNHGYYTVTYSSDDKASLSYKEDVTRQADGSYATSRTIYGKRVIYELNVGSFTSQGTFDAAKNQLSYLKNLGVDVIWLMPVYERGSSNSPYAVKNFKKINSNYGTVAQLKDFVTAAHEMGMDVWLDFVPNHAATNSDWLDANGSDYHPEYFTGYNKDNKTNTDAFVHPNGYNDVWQLDYTSEVTDADGNDAHNPAGRAIEDALKYWLNETDIDGFRFDYVSSQTIPNSFWSSTLSDLKAIKSSLQFLAEADFTRDHNGVNASNFHYDYAWGLNDILRNQGTSSTTYADLGDKNPEANPVDFTHKTANYLKTIKYVSTDPMMYLINHDVNWNDTPNTMQGIWGDNRYAMTVLEFTMPGMPLIYNGQEQNGSQALDYFHDGKIDWTNTRDYNMLGLIQELSYLKHTNNAINDGSNSTLRGETRILNSYEHSVFAYERIKGDQHLIVVLNLSNSVKSPQILGATKGTWKRILKGSNQGIDNSESAETIGDSWYPADIPANGFEIFTYTGENNRETEGIYFVTDDSWNNPTKHKMTATGSDDNYNYYRFEINGSDFNTLSTEEGATGPDTELKFKVQEFYDFLGLGAICKTDQMFGSKTDVTARFTENGTRQFDAIKGSADKEHSFSIIPAADVNKYIITFARSKKNADQGTVSLEIVKNGEIQTGFYLLTPVNINSQNAGERHQWRFNYKGEDPDAVSDKYITDLNEDKRNLCSYVIDASKFDTYIPEARRSGNAIQFRIRECYIPEGATSPVDNASDVVPKLEDKDNEKSTFDASKGDYRYDDANWTSFENNDGYFKILYRPDVARYIIQLWQTGSGSDGKTRVRVYYVRKYNYEGSTIENVSASNEDVYLYNVDAQKFLYVGNTWGTMASLLYDDLGTRLNISDGVTGENTNYKLIRTRFEGAGIVPDGYMLGIDDFGYNANDDDPFNRLDSANIYCDRNNGNRWLFEKADNVDYANTYTLKLFNIKDGRFHYMLADHRDGSDPDAKTINTQVKYVAVDNKSYTAADLYYMGAIQGGAVPLPILFGYRYIGYIGNGGSVKFDYNAAFAGTYDISVNYISGANRKLKVNISSPDGSSTDYEQTSGNTGSWNNANRYETMHYAVKMQKGVNNITFGDQDEDAPNITEISITLSRPSDLKYGRWQLITYKDLVAKLKNENAELYGGTTADATFLLTDQGFTRNVPATWSTDNGHTILDGSNTTSNVVLTKNTIGADPASGMYWNGHITGKGCVYQDISVPMYGIYQFDAFGYYKGSPTRMYYQYATEMDANGNVTKWSEMQGNTPLNNNAPAYGGRDTDIATGTLFYKESVLDNAPAHRTTQFIYMPQKAEGAAIDNNGNYRLRIGFYKTGDAPGDYTAVDDVHLHYNGKSPFILDDSWSENTKTSKLTSDVRENVPVYIKREFWANQWNALVLPVSVSTTQLRQIFGDGVQVASPYGLDNDNPYLIRFTPVDLSSGTNAIEAGRFYIVKPNKLVGTSQVMTITKENENSYKTNNETATNTDGYNIQFYNLGSHDLRGMPTSVADLDVNTVGFHAGSEKHPKHNTIRFKGSFNATKAPKLSYVFASDGNMYHLATEHDLGGFRFFIVDDNNNSASKIVSFGSLSEDLDNVLSSFNNQDSSTGIKDIKTVHEGNGAIGNGDVYDLSGRRVAVKGKTGMLPSGVYIINGKKFIKD